MTARTSLFRGQEVQPSSVVFWFRTSLFPNSPTGTAAKSPKNVKYAFAQPTAMRSSTTQAVLERMVTGDRCEAKGCYELAVWLVAFNGTVAHWCPRHTRAQMRDERRWSDASGPKIKGNQEGTSTGQIR